MCKVQYLVLFSQSKNDFFKESHPNLIWKYRKAVAEQHKSSLSERENPASMN